MNTKPVILKIEELMTNVIQKYEHVIQVDDIKWKPCLVAYLKLVVGNWVMAGFRWEYIYNSDGEKATILTIGFEELKTICVGILPCPTEVKLELLKLKYFPMDKLKELTKIREGKRSKE